MDVTVGNNFFSPQNANVNVNDTVHWSKSGGFHNVFGSGFSSGALTFSAFDFSFTFTSPGTYNYYCQQHGSPNAGMNGNVIVAAAATPPTVTITSPGASSLFNAPANFTVTADAAATSVGVAVSKVEFFVDGSLYDTSFSSPYSVNIVNLPAGFHSVTATVTDSANGTATSQAISVVVNAPPTVSITNLANQAVFAAPATVVVKATAADVDGSVAQVEFFNGVTSVGTATGPAYQKTFSNLTNGTYLLKVVATDDRGATSTATVTIVVTTLKLASPTISSGNFGLQVNGLVPGKTNLVQASTTLTNWVSIATNVAASATAPFADPNATNTFKFYRVIQLP